jgi:hypothetical protein
VRSPPPPIRFLVLVVGGWGAMRSIMLMPDWSEAAAVKEVVGGSPNAEGSLGPARAPQGPVWEPMPAAAFRSSRAKSRGAPSSFVPEPGKSVDRAMALWSAAPRSVARPSTSLGTNGISSPAPAPVPAWRPSSLLGTIGLWSLAPRASPSPRARVAPPGAPALPSAELSRWSASAWLFYRQGGSDAPLAPGGTLGGSQAGARFTYALRRYGDSEVAVSARLYAPFDDRRAAEAAVGLDWKPLRAVPVRLLVERRQALGEHGRSAFSLTAYGGFDEARVGPLRLDAYGQAGVVGARRRDPFADGAARLTLPVGPLHLGGGAWAAAQPGVSRVDAGPHADLRLRVGRASVALSADWRFRLAGNARPGSGPTLTLSTGF